MMKTLTALSFLLLASVWASAQHQPLSPPSQSPVPMTDTDQLRALSEDATKQKANAASSTTGQAPKISVPAIAHSQHISSGNATIDSLVYEAAALHRLDPCLILSVMKAESSFNRQAVSPKGASGLMQLMPATAARFGVKDIFDPRENVLAGAKYLRWLLDRFGDVRLALAGYNAGEGAVTFYGLRIPPFLETQNYVRAIYARYSRIHTVPTPEPLAAQATVATNSTDEKIPTYNQIIRFTSSTGDASAARAGQ